MTTLTINCKLPSGWKAPQIDGKDTITLNGAHSEGAICGYGITHGVDSVLWEKIVEMAGGNDYAPFKSRAITWSLDVKSSVAEAKDNEDTKTGFEGIGDKALKASGVEELKKD